MENRIDYPRIEIKKSAFTKNDSNDLHYGQILEKIVRRSPVGISELARRLAVSRRTVYNWFESERVNIEIIRKIGFIIGHDFSVEFPEDFSKASDYINPDLAAENPVVAAKPNDAVYYWMDKYIKLLERFNSALSTEAKIKIDAMILFLIALLNYDLGSSEIIANTWC